jgi:hypothetical protein
MTNKRAGNGKDNGKGKGKDEGKDKAKHRGLTTVLLTMRP